MDDKFTKSLQAWLDTAPEDRDIPAGAALLLRLDRNRILYNNILRRPERMASKLEYELRKHLRIRLDRMTVRDVALMEQDLLPRVDKTLAAPAPDAAGTAQAPFRGKRADHDQLPAEVQELYERNGETWKRLRSVRESLRAMEKAKPCDRYDLLQLLKSLGEAYHKAWETYDHAAPATDTPAAPAPESSAPAAPTAAAVSAARKFLSENKPKLEGPDLDEEKKTRLVAAMQQRIDTVIASGGGFREDFRLALEVHGLDFTAQA